MDGLIDIQEYIDAEMPFWGLLFGENKIFHFNITQSLAYVLSCCIYLWNTIV